jgi:serine/threonine-protein kinase
VVKVLDFGISKMLGQEPERERPRTNHTREGGLIGTPIYMAPERIRGGIQDGRADVYSVGIMFYEMASGHVPFLTMGDDLVAMLLEQLTPALRPLRELRPDIPEAVEDLVMSALEKNPEVRPDMRTFLQELLQIADSELGTEARRSLVGTTKIEAGPSHFDRSRLGGSKSRRREARFGRSPGRRI